MGSFYGPASSATTQVLHIARYGIAMFFGRSTAYQSLIWIDDAALAVVDGLAKAEAGIYDVVDDEPLQRRELAATDKPKESGRRHNRKKARRAAKHRKRR